MVRQNNEAAKRFVESRAQCAICDPYIGLIIESNGTHIGAIILNDYTPDQNIEMAAMITGAVSAKDVRDIFRYCFARVRRVTCRTSINNLRAIKMLCAFGFKREGLLREWCKDGSDGVLFGLLEAEQRIYR